MLFVLFGEVTGIITGHEVETDVLLLAGEADDGSIAFASAGVFVMMLSVAEHAVDDEWLEFGRSLANCAVQGGQRLFSIRRQAVEVGRGSLDVGSGLHGIKGCLVLESRSRAGGEHRGHGGGVNRSVVLYTKAMGR